MGLIALMCRIRVRLRQGQRRGRVFSIFLLDGVQVLGSLPGFAMGLVALPALLPWLAPTIRGAHSATSLQYAMRTFLNRGNIRGAQSAIFLLYAMRTFLNLGKIWAAQ